MVGWISQKLTPKNSEIDFYIYDLEKSGNTWRKIQLKHELSINWKLCSARIEEICEFKPSSIYAKVKVEPDEEKLGDKLLEDE